MNKLLVMVGVAALAAGTLFGGGKDDDGNAITRQTLFGKVDGEQTTVGDIADFAEGMTPADVTNTVKGVTYDKNTVDKKINSRVSTFVHSEKANYYRSGKSGEMGTGYAYEAIDGSAYLRFSALVPRVTAQITFTGDNPISTYYGTSYTEADMTKTMTALSSESSERGKYNQADYSYSFTNALPIHLSVHRNILQPVPSISSIQADYASIEFTTQDGITHYCYNFRTSGTTVTYDDQWTTADDSGYTTYSFSISIADSSEPDYQMEMFGGVPLTTDANKGDAITTLIERTDKPGEKGTGWGYKIYKYQSDTRELKVKVPSISKSVDTSSRASTDGYFNDVFGADTGILTSETKDIVRTEEKYGVDGCKYVYCTAELVLRGRDLNGNSQTTIYSNPIVTDFILKKAGTDGTIQDIEVKFGVGWSLKINAEGYAEAWEAAFQFSEGTAPGDISSSTIYSHSGYYRTRFKGLKFTVPCDTNGHVTVTKSGSQYILPFTWSCESRSLCTASTWGDMRDYYTGTGCSGSNQFRISATSSLIEMTFPAYSLVNEFNNNEYHDDVLNKDFRLKVTNGSMYLEEIIK